MSRVGREDGNFTMKAKPHFSLHAEYSSSLTTLKIPTTLDPDMKLVSAVAQSSGILEHVRSCVGKAEGLKSTSVAARWFSLMPVKLLLAREPQYSWLFQSYLCGHETACYCP